jgi:hypothetical protein
MNNFIPRDFIVAQGNAFFLLNGSVHAAPVLTKWGGEVEWTEAVEVERQDTEDTAVVDSIFLTLHLIATA